MRKRSWAPTIFASVGFLLIVLAALAAFSYLVLAGSFGPELQERVEGAIEYYARRFVPDGETLNNAAWLGGIGATVSAAAFSLLTAWHFAEMHLPRRLQEMIERNSRRLKFDQMALIAAAQDGLGSIPARFEESRLTYLRSLFSDVSPAEAARQSIAFRDRAAAEAKTLRDAADEARQRQITTLLIEGFHLERSGDRERGLEAFQKAALLDPCELLSKNVAAACARRLANVQSEMAMLAALQEAAAFNKCGLTLATALRRQAELIYRSGRDLGRARVKLSEAEKALSVLASDDEIILELGRVLTLLCEVQHKRNAVGKLQSRRQAMQDLMKGIEPGTAKWEAGGEQYGELRARNIEQLISESFE